MGDRDSGSLDDAEHLPGRLRERRLAWREQAITFDLIEQRPHLAIASREQHLRTPGQSFGLADMAIGAHDYDRLVLAVQAEPPCAQCRLDERRRHSSNTCDWRGTTASHHNSLSLRERSRSEELTSEIKSLMRISSTVIF